MRILNLNEFVEFDEYLILLFEILKIKDKALFSKGRFYPKKIKIENVGSVLESSGQADSRRTSKIKSAS